MYVSLWYIQQVRLCILSEDKTSYTYCYSLLTTAAYIRPCATQSLVIPDISRTPLTIKITIIVKYWVVVCVILGWTWLMHTIIYN